jgi:hypothetical protein
MIMDSPLAGTPPVTDNQPPVPPSRRRPVPVADGSAPAEGSAPSAEASAEGTPAPEGEKLPDAGFDGAQPADGAQPTEAKPAKTNGKRHRTEVTPEVEAKLKAMRAEGKTFMDIHRETGIAIGTIQKYTKAESKARAKAQAAPKPSKAKAKSKTKRAAAKPREASAAAPARASHAVSLKAALFDVLAQGFTADDIRKALASL